MDEDVYFSETRDQYYIYNETGHPLFFDSSLEAKDALREVEIKQAVDAERDRIVSIIVERLSLHTAFIEHALGVGVTPANSIYSAIAELNALLRGLKKEKTNA